MKFKNYFIAFITALSASSAQAQILDIPVNIQEQDQWCWAGVSKSVLNYYGHTVSQCEIAEYNRTVATWRSFGTQNCCTVPNGDCNYWNYNWGTSGSIQDILVHFKNIQNKGNGAALSLTEIKTELSNLRPFVIRWGWTAGGGHFLVGHGLTTDNTLYYMNPWFGEGAKFAAYDWVKSSSDHTWTHTNVILSNPVPPQSTIPTGTTVLCINPVNQTYKTTVALGSTSYVWTLNPSNAGTITNNGTSCSIDFNNTYTGKVSLSVYGENPMGKGLASAPLEIAIGNTPTKPNLPIGNALLSQNPVDQTYTTSEVASASTYLWSINPSNAGTVTETGTSASVNFTNNFLGTAKITVKAQNNCGSSLSSDTLHVKISVISSTSDQALGAQIKTYPNPSTGTLYIDCPTEIGSFLLQVVNVSGQVVSEQQYEANSQNISLNLEDQPNGLYFVHLKSDQIKHSFNFTLSK